MIDLAVGMDAPEFELKNLDGEQVRLSRLAGTPVLLNFYSANCSWCQTEVPRLAHVYQRMSNVDVKVLGVAIGEDEATASQFASEKQLPFPILIDDGTIAATYHLKRVPTIVLVDSDGKVACVYEGVTEQLTGMVEQAILAIAGHRELPEYSLVGNGCSATHTK